MDIQPFDWHRIFLGDVPALFYLEIAFRTLAMYVFALISLRLIGKRGLRQMSPFEFAVVIALGSAVGDPMLYPEVPLVFGFVVIATVVALERIVLSLVRRSPEFDHFVSGKASRLINRGCVDVDAIEAGTLDQEAFFAMLRTSGIEHLGQVKCAFVEQSGELSVFTFPPSEEQPGLPILPPSESDPDVDVATVNTVVEGHWSCTRCGYTTEFDGVKLPPCPVNGHPEWRRSQVPEPASA